MLVLIVLVVLGFVTKRVLDWLLPAAPEPAAPELSQGNRALLLSTGAWAFVILIGMMGGNLLPVGMCGAACLSVAGTWVAARELLAIHRGRRARQERVNAILAILVGVPSTLVFGFMGLLAVMFSGSRPGFLNV
jgi:hypothetical protein